MTESEYEKASNDLAGFCTNCKKIVNHGDVESDARKYVCEECEMNTVYGIEQALIEGIIEIE